MFLLSWSLVGHLHLQHGTSKRYCHPNHAPRPAELPLNCQRIPAPLFSTYVLNSESRVRADQMFRVIALVRHTSATVRVQGLILNCMRMKGYIDSTS